MGAAAVEQRARGINPFKTDIGVLILLNLGLSFVLSKISIGGHIGGLLGGVLVGVVFEAADRMRRRELGYAGCLVLSAIAVVGALAARRRAGLSRRRRDVRSAPAAARECREDGARAQTSTSSAAPAGSGTRSGCRMWAMSSRPSTRRGPGREK